MPVPLPAVAELATGLAGTCRRRGRADHSDGHGAAGELAERCEDLPAMVVQAVGVGAGTKDIAGRANVTRVVLGEPWRPRPPRRPARRCCWRPMSTTSTRASGPTSSRGCCRPGPTTSGSSRSP